MDNKRSEFFWSLAAHLPSSELYYVQRAYLLAEERHRGQMRDNGREPYFEHLRRVAMKSARHYPHCAFRVSVALLHDILEDTETQPREIIELFNTEIFADVMALSRRLGVFHPVTGTLIERAEIPTEKHFKALSEASEVARFIKIIDCTDNLETTGSERSSDRILRKIKEVEEYVLPFADRTHAQAAIELRSVIAKRKHLQRN